MYMGTLFFCTTGAAFYQLSKYSLWLISNNAMGTKVLLNAHNKSIFFRKEGTRWTNI